MVRAPYWAAARIWRVAAAGLGRIRISGTYTLNTGKDLDRLPVRLRLDVIEAWIWDRFDRMSEGGQEAADDWVAERDALPLLVFGAPGIPDFDVHGCVVRAAIAAAGKLLASLGGEPVDVDVFAGWAEPATRAAALFGDGEPLYD